VRSTHDHCSVPGFSPEPRPCFFCAFADALDGPKQRTWIGSLTLSDACDARPCSAKTKITMRWPRAERSRIAKLDEKLPRKAQPDTANCLTPFLIPSVQACSFHPGPSSTFMRNQNHLDKCTFLCCGAAQIGTNPVLFNPPPCKTGRHVSQEDKTQIVQARRTSRQAVGVTKPLVNIGKPAPRAFGTSTARK
jgi:hypothetical protein